MRTLKRLALVVLLVGLLVFAVLVVTSRRHEVTASDGWTLRAYLYSHGKGNWRACEVNGQGLVKQCWRVKL